MAVINEKDDDAVQSVSIQIGNETFSAKWAKPLPHAEAMRRVRVMLSTFDREPALPTQTLTMPSALVGTDDGR